MAKNPSSKSDELLRLLADHPENEAAWRNLYMEYWPFVFGTIYRLVNGKTEDARDLSQEIFVRLAKYRPFPSLVSAEKFRAYLGTACKHIVYDFFRHSQQQKLVSDTNLENLIAAERFPSEGLREQLQQIYEEVDEPERHLLDLLISGASTAEIANHLKISEVSARVRVHRFRARIKAILGRS